MAYEELIVPSLTGFMYGLIVLALILGVYMGYLLYRTYKLEKLIKVLISTIEINIYHKKPKEKE